MEINKIYNENCLETMARMPDRFVDCLVTSPPYYNLRSYGTEPQVWGGDASCEHVWGETLKNPKADTRTPEEKIAQGGSVGSNVASLHWANGNLGNFCQLCNAWRGELGLEPTFDCGRDRSTEIVPSGCRKGCYICHLIDIFREVKRVLKPTGTVFVNLGDSYSGSGRRPTGHNGIGNQSKRQGFSDASDVIGRGTFDRALLDSLGGDRPFQSLDDVRTDASAIRTLGTETRHALKQVAELCQKIREYMVLHFDRSPTADSILPRQTERSLATILDCLRFSRHESERLLSFLESTPELSLPLLPAVMIQTANDAFDLSVFRSFAHSIRASVDRLVAVLDSRNCTGDSVVLSEELHQNIQYIYEYCLQSVSVGTDWLNLPYNQPHYTTDLRPKSLLNIPSRFAIAMTDELHFIQRNKINWWKRACMPSSAKDRFTVDFEDIYFFVKNPKYYFEQQLESLSVSTAFDRRTINEEWSIARPNRGHNGQQQQATAMLKPTTDGYRNMRTTWDIPFEPSGEEHYAAYPTKLVERMIKAGCPENGLVYDPFGGTATTAVTAHKLGRNWICSELQPKYVNIAERRLSPHLNQPSLI